MNPVAKGLIIFGGILILIGLLWQVGGKFFPLGKLPGDIVIEKENMKVYFPIVTCILISVVLSLLSYLFRLFR
ncbi:DUF2905 domain-containing protein [Paenactinomyces guangxiensis]|uniref:DUF2905 domain-containing protein n=1 Tax=Paenactinomyces guangxiensis TaxID=1490290 RepID=A0A7W2A9Z6_9BACL|nr:DUF2905 domain-containing protein [Paenactinomyces guangxiensis]MBA4495754.1 DUF2905 domain-containing protein [Paenactinomyces guangxiensis]MBH8592743.1 DUF2905 domain-containing protein [Paenactinomyces guangxiensis]